MYYHFKSAIQAFISLLLNFYKLIRSRDSLRVLNFDCCPSLSLFRFCYPLTLLRYADKHIVNNKYYIKKMHIEKTTCDQNEYDTVKGVDFIHVYFCEAANSMQYRQPNSYQEVSNPNNFDSVSELAKCSQHIEQTIGCDWATLRHNIRHITVI